MKGRLAKIFKGDKILWIILILLSLISLMIVYSATGKLAYSKASGNTLFYLVKQIRFILIGFGIMLFLVNVVPTSLYFKISPALIGITFIALVVALIQFKTSGTEKETSRSLNISFFSFQPAELAKISLILFSARLLSMAQRTEEELKKAFYKITVISGVICTLLFLSNFSTAALIFVTILILMWIARVPLKNMSSLIAVGILAVLLIYTAASTFPDSIGKIGRMKTVKSRIDDHIFGDKDAISGTTQADYAHLAIFEGGIIGKGPGNSEASNYMEAAYNDFIYAIIIEEYGIVGGIITMFIYLILLYRGVVIVRQCNKAFPAFTVAGLVLLITFQAFINMAVSAGAVPVTGQPLPWISLGGSSMLFTAVAFGIILSVSANNKKEEMENKKEAENAELAPNETLETLLEKASETTEEETTKHTISAT